MLLSSKGFESAYNMVGGLRAFKGRTATGPADFGLEEFVGTQDFESAFSMALAMEHGLQKFYLALAEEQESAPLRDLLLKLASFEEGHIKRLMARCPECTDLENAEEGRLEGGWKAEDVYPRIRAQILSLVDILEFAMMLETQAMDLYARMADRSTNDEAQKLFLDLSHEEKGHLDFLDREFDKILSENNG